MPVKVRRTRPKKKPRRSFQMTSYPVSDDKAARLKAVRDLQIVGTRGSEAFDILARLAASEFDCPVGFISILDADRQWLQAECGMGTRQTDREIAFCNYTILGSKVFVVEDARADERFANNPLVTGSPN